MRETIGLVNNNGNAKITVFQMTKNNNNKIALSGNTELC